MALDLAFFEGMERRIPKGRVRTRFAPSPTGYMHVGNLRTALYTWLAHTSFCGAAASPAAAAATSSCASKTPTRAAWWRARWT